MAKLAFPFNTALVTGASSGIGREVSRQLGRAGVWVAAVARRQAELETLAGEISRAGSQAFVFPADLSRPEEALRVAADAEKALGRIDLLLANAGIGSHESLARATWETIQRTMMVNSLSAMALIHSALPGMRRRKFGYIAGVSSLASYLGLPGSVAYSASKAALSVFLESVRIETRGQGIFVTDIHPGFVRTGMTAGSTTPLPFLMDAERAAGLILRAIVKKKRVYNFPWQMALLSRIGRILPPAILDPILASRSRRQRDTSAAI